MSGTSRTHNKMNAVHFKSMSKYPTVVANLKRFRVYLTVTAWNCLTATGVTLGWDVCRRHLIHLSFFSPPLSEWQRSHGADVNCMWWLITWAETFKRSATHLKERGLRRCWSGKISLTLSLEATPCPAAHCAAPVKTNMFFALAQLSQAVSSQVTYPHTHPLMPPFASARSNLHDSIPIVQIKGRD